MIFQTIRATVQFHRLNERVKDQMREWFLATGIEVAQQMEAEGNVATNEYKQLVANVASMLLEFGRFSSAIEYYQKALAFARAWQYLNLFLPTT